MAEPDQLQGLMDGMAEQAAEAATPAPPGEMGSGFKPPSADQILKMLESLNISDMDKDEIRKNILNPNMLKNLLGGKQRGPQVQYIYVIACVVVLLLIFVFFGYKLYRSLTEKERKREEKKKQKQQKKKK